MKILKSCRQVWVEKACAESERRLLTVALAPLLLTRTRAHAQHTHAHTLSSPLAPPPPLSPPRVRERRAARVARPSFFSPSTTIRLSGGPPPPPAPRPAGLAPAGTAATMTAPFNLTVVNCPSQVQKKGGRGARPRAGKHSDGARAAPPPHDRTRPLLPPPSLSPQDLAKTNLAFVSVEEPAVGHAFLEVNGW